MAETALYYPYMRIEDEGWLRATLLLFDQVQRIVPEPEVAGDSPYIRRYIKAGLLGPAPLSHEHVRNAQDHLASSIKADARKAKFRESFSEERTLREREKGDHLGFQMHHRKLEPSLRQVLNEHRLAWVPGQREIFDVNADYVAMHPVLGEAIMSTLGVACALTEGAHIVGDKRSGPLHEMLKSLKVDDIYRGVVDGGKGGKGKSARPGTAHEVFDVLVALACDTSKIGPEELAKLGDEREAIQALVGQLSARAQSIGTMFDGDKRDKAFRKHAAEILRDWKSDASNMSNYVRRLLGLNLLDPGKDTMTALLEAGLTVANASSAGGLTSLLTSPFGPIVQFGSTVAVGLVSHGIKSYVEMRSDAGKSTYRYLTAMEKAGVVFRSEISPRTDRHSSYPDHDCSEMDEPCEVDSSTFVAGGEAPEVFEAIEAALDAIAMLVDDWIVRDDGLAGTI